MNHLDLSFDHLFEARDQLKWWPWVGSEFARSAVKTMVLGESVYRWSKGEAFDKRYALTSGLRVTHSNHALDFGRKSRYVRNIERAIFQRRNPSDAQKQMLWSSVIYHNLVLEAMESVKHRPEEKQYQKGWTAALDLFDVMSVEQCLVFGVESLNALRLASREEKLRCSGERHPTKVGRFCARSAVVHTRSGRPVKLLFVRHPSSFFSWRKWAPVVGAGLNWDFAEALPTPEAQIPEPVALTLAA
ncbi:hypothetical protein AWB79_05430 [Caballeronia hypogeia]|uniref:Uncharacterized protein n=1 Tax=Caballeronia hypogeia TaxID=1777140 RepID=A0A158CIG3_9BURK|nr:hypothetical protein [Caballeronia hypogeia]SAK82105.1 hypothetical protein AWB79_05430 [Caballeronia hypogeia]